MLHKSERKQINSLSEKLKSYLDELHPMFAFLRDKNLRDVASRIAVNKVFIDTEFDNTASIGIETMELMVLRILLTTKL